MPRIRKSPLTVLEFNSTTIRVCCSSLVKKERVVTHCFSFEVKESENETSDKIREQFKSHGLIGKEVILALPRAAAISRLLRLPARNTQEIKAMVTLQISSGSFGIKSENILYDWRSIGFDKEGYALVSIFLMHREKIHKYIEILNKADMRIRRVTLNTEGLIRWSKKNGDKGAGGRTRCLHLLNADHDTFDFNLFLGGYSVFSRTFAAPDSKDPAYASRLSKEVKVSWELARRLTCPYFDHDDKLYLTGMRGAFAFDDLEGFFERPVETFLRDTPVSYAAVMGLALEEAGAIDLTPQEVRIKNQERKKFCVMKKALRLLALALAVASVLLSLAVDRRIARAGALKKELKAQEVLEKEAQRVALVHFLKKRVYKDHLILEVFNELFRLVPPSLFLDTLKIERENDLSWTGTSPDASVLFEFLGSCERSPLFKEVRLDYVRDQKSRYDSRITFRMRVTRAPESPGLLPGDEGAKPSGFRRGVSLGTASREAVDCRRSSAYKTNDETGIF